MPNLGDRARGILADLDRGSTTRETRDAVETLLGDLVALDVDEFSLHDGIAFVSAGHTIRPDRTDAVPARTGTLDVTG